MLDTILISIMRGKLLVHHLSFWFHNAILINIFGNTVVLVKTLDKIYGAHLLIK